MTNMATRRNPLASREHETMTLASGNDSRMLAIAQIRRDGQTQPRQGMNEDVVNDYVAALAEGVRFPPIDVMFDGQVYWLFDGFHRIESHLRAGCTEIYAKVHQGTLEQAQWRSYAANQSHGLRRSTADKERAIRSALRHPAAQGLSNRQIANHLGVDDKTIGKYRAEMQAVAEIPQLERRTGADGKQYQASHARPVSQTTTAEAPRLAPGSVACPQCGNVQKDEDGFGVIHCKRCGHCPHYLVDGYCDVCGVLVAIAGVKSPTIEPTQVAPVAAPEPFTLNLPADLPPDQCSITPNMVGRLIAYYDDGDGSQSCTFDDSGSAIEWLRDRHQGRLAYLARKSVAPSQPAAQEAAPVEQPGDKRRVKLESILALYINVLASCDEFGGATGRYGLTTPLRRAIEPMIAELRVNLA